MIARLGSVRGEASSRLGPVRLIRPPGEMGTTTPHPPNGAAFYPFYSTTNANGTCTWQEGGNFIPGTTNNFGGSSTSEYGPLLATVFPTVGATGPTTVTRFDNFNSGDIRNPCPVKGAG